MANEEFNLSILENVTTFDTPLKESSDYDAILSLIKEEIDIAETEDENEPEKAIKSPPMSLRRKESESCSSESVFKWPYRKKNCLRFKSSQISLNAQREKWLECERRNARERGARLLGRAKPGRSFQTKNRRRGSSISQSETSALSEYGDESVAESKEKFTEKKVDAESSELNNTERKDISSVKERIIDSTNADDENSRCSEGESTSLLTTDLQDVASTNESLIENSQSTTKSSEERPKLNLCVTNINPPITDITKESLKNSLIESEEENPNFSLSLSPESKSGASAIKIEASASPLRLRERKAVCRVSPLKGLTQKLENLNDKNTQSALLLEEKRENIDAASPLKGLTQELENCIRNKDCVEMCDSETESMSFTFETIQMINDYEDCNQEANNKILDKILSSPAKSTQEKISTIDDNFASNEENPVEDPLYIKDTDIIADVPPSTSKRKESITKKPEASKRKSSEIETNEDSSNTKETDDDANIPTTSKRKRIMRKKPIVSNGESSAVAKDTKRSNRSKNKEPIDTIASDWESDSSISVRATKIAEKLDAVQKKEALSMETLNKLRKLVVKLRHEVPPQHEIESCAGSNSLLYHQQKEFLQYAPLNKEKYTPKEDKVIKENWNAFCEDHNWDPNDYKPFLRLKHGKHLIMSNLEERRKFVQFLANGLPNRPLCSVYNRFRLLYNKYNSASLRYTKKEDAQIIAFMKCPLNETLENKCSQLSKVINRSRISIWKRYKKLNEQNCPIEKKKRVLSKVEWDLSLVDEFIKTLLDVTISDELIDLKDAFLPRVVWLKMEEKMNIKYDFMQRFWDRQLHMQLFSPEPINLNEIKIKLIEYMHFKRMKNHREINWNNVVKYFDGYTISFLRHVFNHLTTSASLTLHTRDFGEILQWLHNKKINELRFTLKDKSLPRIIYKDKAELVAEDLARVRLVSENSEDD